MFFLIPAYSSLKELHPDLEVTNLLLQSSRADWQPWGQRWRPPGHALKSAAGAWVSLPSCSCCRSDCPLSRELHLSASLGENLWSPSWCGKAAAADDCQQWRCRFSFGHMTPSTGSHFSGLLWSDKLKNAHESVKGWWLNIGDIQQTDLGEGWVPLQPWTQSDWYAVGDQCGWSSKSSLCTSLRQMIGSRPQWKTAVCQWTMWLGTPTGWCWCQWRRWIWDLTKWILLSLLHRKNINNRCSLFLLFKKEGEYNFT